MKLIRSSHEHELHLPLVPESAGDACAAEAAKGNYHRNRAALVVT